MRVSKKNPASGVLVSVATRAPWFVDDPMPAAMA